MAVPPPKDHRSAGASGASCGSRTSPPCTCRPADSSMRRRRRTSAPSAGQLGQPCSRAMASWAAESVTRPETARSLAIARGSPSAAARSSSRAWRRSWSRSGRSGSSDMTSPRRPGSRSGAMRRRSCRKARPCTEAAEVDSGPAREPGGALPRRHHQPTRRHCELDDLSTTQCAGGTAASRSESFGS